MSYWADNPELYDEIIFKQMVKEGVANEDDDMEIAVREFIKTKDSWKLISRAESAYWGDRIDYVMNNKEGFGK